MSAKQQHITNNQSGLVSITVVMIMMGILVLITTSFALLMTREQRQALDRQLSTQAFYAAESGVHDIAGQIDTVGEVTDCADTPGRSLGNNVLDGSAAAKVEYSCVLVDKSPDMLVYDPISLEDSTVVRLESGTGNISRIDISWEDSAEDGTLGNQFVPTTNAGHFLPQAGVASAETDSLRANNGTGILRATLMPIATPASITRQALIDDARTYFLYPKSGSANASKNAESFGANGIATANNARFIDGGCNTGHTNKQNYPRNCNVTINTNNTTPIIYLRMLALYKKSAVTISIYTGTGGSQVRTQVLNAQAVIDSTGRANDVLRRIQVRVPLSGGYHYPDYALETMDSICKRTAFPQAGNSPSVDLPLSGSNNVNVDYNRSVDEGVCSPSTP